MLRWKSREAGIRGLGRPVMVNAVAWKDVPEILIFR